MSIDFQEFYGSQFTVEWVKFHISENGDVTCEDWMELGHLEECLEEWKTILDLTELLDTIDLGVSK